jgi:hypothetical protein
MVSDPQISVVSRSILLMGLRWKDLMKMRGHLSDC